MIKEQLIRQFRHPHGPLGHVAGRIMATRSTNITRNRWIVDVLDPEPEARLLEIGHGPGLAIEAIAERLTTGHITGAEVSELMSNTAARRNRRGIAAGNVEFVVADAQALPAHLHGFDVIYGVNVSMFWNDLTTTVEHLSSRLAPRGRLVLAFMPPPTSDADPDKVAEELSTAFGTAGLEDIRTERMASTPPTIAVLGSRA